MYEPVTAMLFSGEQNAHVNMDLYNCTFPAMIADWRLKWGQSTMGQTRPDFPFGFVQVHNSI